MNHAIKAGTILAVLVSLISAIVIGSGLILGNLMLWQLVVLLLFIGLTVTAVIWALRQSASETGYGGQILNALVLGLVGAVLITALSFVMSSFIFPDSLAEISDVAIDMIEASAMSDEIKDAQIKSVTSTTPFSNALSGGALP